MTLMPVFLPPVSQLYLDTCKSPSQAVRKHKTKIAIASVPTIMSQTPSPATKEARILIIQAFATLRWMCFVAESLSPFGETKCDTL